MVIHMPDEIHAQYPKKECYVCRRSQDDLKALQGLITQEFDMMIDDLENEFQEYEGNIEKILEDSYPAELLDFKVHTVESDIAKFKKMIPYVDDLLKFKTDLRDRKKGRERREPETLADIRERLKNRPKGEWVDRQLVYKHQSFIELKFAKEAYENGDFWKIGLHRANIDFEKMTGHNIYQEKMDKISSRLELNCSYHIYICTLCNHLLEEASNARADDDYDDDDW